VVDEGNPLLFGADVCFLEANTWHPIQGLWHQSALGDLGLVQKWKPKRTYLVHYSGYEDRDFPGDPIRGPMSIAQLREALRQAGAGYDLQPAQHGMVLGDSVSWPE
jgi:hypothetical protein